MRHAATATARPLIGGIRARGRRRAPGRRRAAGPGPGTAARIGGDVRRVAWTAEPALTSPAAAVRQAPVSRTRAVAQVPYLIVLAGTAAALAAVRVGAAGVRSGTLVLAGVLLFAAIARLALPDGRAGMLSSRRRWLDVTIFAAFGAGLLAAALVALPA